MPKPPKPPDLTDRLAAGTLPDDLTADTEPMDPPTPERPAPKPKTKARPKTQARTLSALLPAAFARLRRRQSGEEDPIPLPWPTVAEPLGGGLRPEGLHILVGNTAAGKTQWCLQTAIHAAQQGVPTLYVALEAGEVEFVARCLGLVAETHWSRLYRGQHDGLERLIEQHAPTLEQLPLEVLLPPPHGWNYDDLDAEVERLRTAHPEQTPGDTPLLVVLDFLQIVGAHDPHQDLRERIGRAAYVGRGVARKYNAAVLLASSTARENYLLLTGRKRGKSGVEQDKENQLGKGPANRFIGLGKESGEIEYAADTVIVLTQEPWPDKTAPPGGTVCHLALAKIRDDQPQWVELRFDGRSFTEPKPSVHGTVTV